MLNYHNHLHMVFPSSEKLFVLEITWQRQQFLENLRVLFQTVVEEQIHYSHGKARLDTLFQQLQCFLRG